MTLWKMPIDLEKLTARSINTFEGYVYAIAKPLHLGKSTHVWEIKMNNEAGKLVCI